MLMCIQYADDRNARASVPAIRFRHMLALDMTSCLTSTSKAT